MGSSCCILISGAKARKPFTFRGCYCVFYDSTVMLLSDLSTTALDVCASSCILCSVFQGGCLAVYSVDSSTKQVNQVAYVKLGCELYGIACGDSSVSCVAFGGRSIYTIDLFHDADLDDKTTVDAVAQRSDCGPSRSFLNGVPVSERVVDIAQEGSVVKLSMGSAHSAYLTDKGRVFLWGNNDFGQLGLDAVDSSDAAESHVPFCELKVEGILRWIDVSCGGAFTLAAGLNSEGVRHMYGFGSNECGQLGIARLRLTSDMSWIPLRIVSSQMMDFGDFCCSETFSVILSRDGRNVYVLGTVPGYASEFPHCLRSVGTSNDLSTIGAVGTSPEGLIIRVKLVT